MSKTTKITAEKINVYYGDNHALKDINLDIIANQITALIGPSGCGKTSFLRCVNRMNDEIETCRVEGKMVIDGQDVYAPDVDVVQLRTRTGLVFQKPNPFPKSIFDNVAYAPRLHGLASGKDELEHLVQDALTKAGLWEEVRDRLTAPALGLSGGQQQRLCIARAIAGNPDIILMDEPCSALDPIATAVVENTVDSLKERYTILIVTHSMQQAARLAQRTAFFHMGDLIEYGETNKIFTAPKKEKTQNYITGKIG